MNQIAVHPIGRITHRDGETVIALARDYLPALTGLGGFSHIQVLWWFDRCDNAAARQKRTEKRPYKKGPEVLGVFATRSPQRPNPIALTAALVTRIDAERGLIGLAYLDAYDGSPVLDIKPYTPSLDRVESPAVPAWCAHWPRCSEDSGDFDWGNEFNF